MPSVDKPPKSKEKGSGKEKKEEGSFFGNLKNSLFRDDLGKQEDRKTSKSPEDVAGESKDKDPVKDKTSIEDKDSTPFPEKKKTKKEEEVSKTKDSVPKTGKSPKTKVVPQTKRVPKTKEGTPQSEKKGAIAETPEEEPTLHIVEDIKSHEIVQWLRKRKEKIIKGVAITISAILILIAIIYSLTPTEQVASNVIFGEGAMFSVFLVLVAFLILAAVFARRLLEGKFLREIHQNLEIVEGKREKNDSKQGDDQKPKQEDDQKKSNGDPSNRNPITEDMNKKDK